ncbi:carotenoid oxygenase [Fusarium redolens]|uniref:Carotenoid oxygenase n=1 Tax=Fusarium redolens TaxID=48865 RepID=A0A9P9FVZ4_FUSRE|nr:carotenoid oxygenase [Fusarium redolens]KAH7205417.1 carotenoid oxygenase [Fusarium redolens]
MDITEARLARRLATRNKPGKSWPKDKNSFFTGFMEPVRFEGSLENAIVEGEVPKGLYGVLFRVHPDNQFAPRFEDEEWFAGDGCAFALRFKDGNVDFQKKYVRTEKFIKEREAKQALYGYYGNPWSALPEVGVRDEKTDLSTANTNLVFHPSSGLLLALDELNPPYALNPFTLDTIGTWNFQGTLEAFTMTAHPKYDHETGELVCFSNEAEGHCSGKLYYFTVGPNGRITESLWFENPYGMNLIHDCIVSKKYLIIILIPQKVDVDWNKKCNKHYAWEPEADLVFGLIPRHSPAASDVKWFHLGNSFAGHSANGYDLGDGRVVMDVTIADENCMPWYPTKDGVMPDINAIEVKLARIYFDPKLPGTKHRAEVEIIQRHSGEFPRIDDRFQTRDYTTIFVPALDANQPTDFDAVLSVAGPVPFFNCMTMLDVKTRERKVWFAGPHHGVLEPVFIPRSKNAPEADGWVIFQRNCYDTMTTDFAILDTRCFENGPVAIVKLPFRIRPGFHGNWVDGNLLESFREKYEP